MGSASYEIWALTLPNPISATKGSLPITTGSIRLMPYAGVTDRSVNGMVVLAYGNNTYWADITVLYGRDSKSTDRRVEKYVPTREELSSKLYLRAGAATIYYEPHAADYVHVVSQHGLYPTSPDVPFDIENATFILTDMDKALATEGQVIVPAQLGTLTFASEPEALTLTEIGQIVPGEDYTDIVSLRETQGYEQSDPTSTVLFGSWSGQASESELATLQTIRDQEQQARDEEVNGTPEKKGGGGLLLAAAAAAGAFFLLGG
jgi:hypothetical protein